MTERLYYLDSYVTEFSAHILRRTTAEERPAVVLDRTYFYPTGGGQPHDTGTINGAAVLEVITDPDDHDAVVHVLDAEIDGEEAACIVSWERRLDHMQHHTGQHILTQAFMQVANTNTVGFHLSDNSATIDLDTTTLDTGQIAGAETRANQIIWENRPVTTRLISPDDDTENVRVRKMPGELHTAGLRVIEIAGFDATACGGTHVLRTGEIGLVKVLKTERRGDKTRVEFRCGRRAMEDYQLKNTLVNQMTALLTCGVEEVEQAVLRLRDDLKQSHKAHKAASKQLMEYESVVLLTKADTTPSFRLIKRVFEDRSIGELRALINQLIAEPGVIILAGIPGEKAQLLFARSENIRQDMNALIQRVIPILGNAGGGGRPNFAQGGGVKANRQMLETVLDAAEIALRNE